VKPKKRSILRINLGKVYYTIKRYFEWYFGKDKYAKIILNKKIGATVYKHGTPLYRKLKDVDMWYQQNKVNNLKIAVNKLNGLVLYPGETFSYWRLIGKPTRKKGYVDGMVLYYGTFKPGVGGGLCQLSNLIYWITLHTALKVVERHRHSYDVFPDSKRNQPFGSGATCAYNYLDLRITNKTTQPYQLNLYLSEDELIGEWVSVNNPLYSYEVYEKDHKITQEYWGGYVRHNTIYRRTYNSNHELINDEYITENHAIMMYQPFLSESS